MWTWTWTLFFFKIVGPIFESFLSFSYGRSFDIVKLNKVKSHKRNNCCMLSCIGVNLRESAIQSEEIVFI